MSYSKPDYEHIESLQPITDSRFVLSRTCGTSNDRYRRISPRGAQRW